MQKNKKMAAIQHFFPYFCPHNFNSITFFCKTGGFQSGQMGQTVNLLAFAFGGSNPSPPTLLLRK